MRKIIKNIDQIYETKTEILGAQLVTFHAGTHLIFIPERLVAKLLAKNLTGFKNNYKGKIPFTVENMPSSVVGGVQTHYPKSLKHQKLRF